MLRASEAELAGQLATAAQRLLPMVREEEESEEGTERATHGPGAGGDAAQRVRCGGAVGL